MPITRGGACALMYYVVVQTLLDFELAARQSCYSADLGSTRLACVRYHFTMGHLSSLQSDSNELIRTQARCAP